MNKKEKDFKLKKIKEHSQELYNQIVSKDITFIEGYNKMMSNLNVTSNYATKGTRHKDKKGK